MYVCMHASILNTKGSEIAERPHSDCFLTPGQGEQPKSSFLLWRPKKKVKVFFKKMRLKVFSDRLPEKNMRLLTFAQTNCLKKIVY